MTQPPTPPAFEEEPDGQVDRDLLTEELFWEGRRQRRDLRRLPTLLLAAVKLVWQTNPRSTATTVVFQLSGALVASLQVLLASFALKQLLHEGGESSSLLLPLIALAAVTLVGSLSSSASGLMGRLLTLQVERHVIDDVMEVATRVPLVDYDDPVFYNQLNRVLSNAPVQPYQVVSSISAFVGGLAGVVALLVSLVALSPILAVVVLASAPVLWRLAKRGGVSEFDFAIAQTVNVRERVYLQDLLSRRETAAEARAYGTAATLRARFADLYDSFIVANAALVRRRYLLSALSALATAITATTAMGVLYLLIRDGQMTVAKAATGLFAIRLLTARLQMLVGGISTMFQSSLFLEDFDDFIRQRGAAQTATPEPTARLAEPTDRVSGVQLEHVRFCYPATDLAAVDDVTLHIPEGQIVALVGENGSGKTTLAKLVAGLYEPSEGRLTWHSRGGAEVERQHAQHDITLVLQDFARYQFSVRENVALGRPERMLEDDVLREAARDAGIAEIAESLPMGYDTRLSRQFEGGRDLSLGQWQRLALARAFFRDGSLVVLDEPAAALDPRAERRLYDSVRKLLQGRTVILITHRMQSVRGADRILVMQAGRIVEDGDHATLSAAGGLYAELVALQEGGGLHGSGKAT